MTAQPDLFGAAPVPRHLARRSDPATSHAAAKTVPAFAGDHHTMILRVLRKLGRRGGTVHEVAALCRLDAHAVGKRMAELERAKLVECLLVPDGDAPDGTTVATRTGPNGRQARVWVCTKGGAA